jgi:hypothetical protein
MITANYFTARLDMIVQAHNAGHAESYFDFFVPGYRLTIQPHRDHDYAPALVVEVPAPNLVRVAQVEQDTPVIEAVFYTANIGGWVPIGMRRLYSDYYRPFARLSHDFCHIASFTSERQLREAVVYCNTSWYARLQTQGFLRLRPLTISSHVTELDLLDVRSLVLA